MEKKSTIIYLIFIGAVAISAVAFIIFSGITAKDYNYVQLEINPRVEFICDQNFDVVSWRPLNEDAEILLSEVNYKGLDVDEASVDFVDLCARAGYIDVDGEDNAVNITIIDGITQALDVHVTQSVYEYLKHKEILCTVVENYEDRSMFDEKKENNICCANKYKLIKTIQEYSQNPEDKEFNIANGVFYTYKENEKIISKILYKNNKIIENELWEYYPTGELYIKATNKNNQASGKYLEYAQNGIIVVDENYLNNKPDGVKKEYYRNGNIKFVGYYKGGLPYGKSTSYWRNGNLSNETNYLNGKKHGVSKSYWENGNIAFYDTYSNGTITSKKAYDMYGKELWSQKY